MGSAYGLANRVKKAMNKKPKWSFGKVTHWKSRNKKRTKKLTIKKDPSVQIKRVSQKDSRWSWSIVLLCIGGFFVWIPTLIIASIRSLYHSINYKSDFRIYHENRKSDAKPHK